MDVTKIGRHRCWRSGGVLGLHFEGSVTAPDLFVLREVMTTIKAEAGYVFVLADMTRGTGIDPEARKYMAEWSKERLDLVSGTAVYGLNFATRAITMLALNAIKLIGKRQLDVIFCKDETEARQWIEQQRLLRSPERAHDPR